MAQKQTLLNWLRDAAAAPHDECLPWPGYVNRRGYGAISVQIDGKVCTFLTSRLACYFRHGEPPTPKHETAHSCKQNPTCCNGNHVRWALPYENADDKVGHGTSNRVIDYAAAVEIRKRVAAGEAKKALAREFGLAPKSIRDIVDEKYWVRP